MCLLWNQNSRPSLPERLSKFCFAPTRGRKPKLALIIHIELDRVRVHGEAVDFFHLHFDIGVDLIVVEHVTGFQEAAVAIEGFERFAQATADLWDVFGFFG